MPTPPSHSGPVTLADFTPRGQAVSVLRDPPMTFEGGFNSPLRSRVTYLVEARDLYNFILFATGKPYTVTVGMGTAVRIIPLSHPDLPQLICTGVGGVCKGGFTFPDDVSGSTGRTATLSNWSHAAVTCEFTTVPYLVDGSTPFMTTETRGAGESYSLAGLSFAFPSDGQKVEADASVSVPVVVYQLTIYQAFALDDSVLNPLLEAPVGSTTFLGQDGGQFRFDGYNSSSTTTQGGQQSYTRTIAVAWRAKPWNQVIRSDGDWEEPLDEFGDPIYFTSDLNALLA